MNVDSALLKSVLVARGWTLRRLASAMDLPPSTLSAWLHGVGSAPTNLASRIAAALSIAPETFCRSQSK